MAYDSGAAVNSYAGSASVRTDEFRRSERLVVLMGGAALGILAGFGTALAIGRIGVWALAIGAPLYLIALYLAVATFRDAIDRRAFGCAAAASAVALSLLAWPAMAVLAPMSTLVFWIAPGAALGAMTLLASCWGGAPSAIYRLSGEAGFLCAIVGFLGFTQIMS